MHSSEQLEITISKLLYQSIEKILGFRYVWKWKQIFPSKCIKMRIDFKLQILFKFRKKTNHSDYITEKFWENALQCGAIPVIHGTVKNDFLKQGIPADSFIHSDDFDNASELANYLIKVANDEDLYNSYFKWRKGRDVLFPNFFGMYYCAVVDYFFKNNPKPRKNISISDWFPKNWHL